MQRGGESIESSPSPSPEEPGGTAPTGFGVDEILHPEEQRQFRSLCIETTPEELAELDGAVAIHLEQVQALAQPATDVDTALALGAAIHRLLGAGIDFDAEQRRIVRGAIEYFLMTDDADGDLDHPLGFDDDTRVLNAALQRIGRPEFAVEPPG